MDIGQKIQAILAREMLEAKQELLLFVNQTRETIKYQTDKQSYIKELLANYNRLSTDKDGYISFFGRWFVNSGFPVFSDEEVLAQMKHFYLCYVEKPMLGESGAIDAAEREGGLFLERWSKYNWLRNLLEIMADPQQVQASTPLPVELQTDEAIRYIDKANKLGLIDDNGHWLKGLQMLACFARDMSIKLHLGKGERIAWQPFEKYFGIAKGRLRLNYNDIQKTGQTPTDIYLIDKVFE